MTFPYRWSMAVAMAASILCCGYFFDVSGLFQQFNALQKTKEDLIGNIARSAQSHLEKDVTNAFEKVNETEMLAHLTLLAHRMGVQLQSVSFKEKHLQEEGIANVMLQADFRSVFSMIAALNDRFILMDFTYKAVDSMKVLASFKLLLVRSTHANLMGVVMQNNPFCSSSKNIVFKSNATKSMLIPLDQIKIVGYLAQDGKTMAILKAIDGSVASVAVGSVIGEEHGVVKMITRDFVLVRMSDGSEKKIRQ